MLLTLSSLDRMTRVNSVSFKCILDTLDFFQLRNWLLLSLFVLFIPILWSSRPRVLFVPTALAVAVDVVFSVVVDFPTVPQATVAVAGNNSSFF